MLVLHDINQRDAGNYVCVVENSIGTGYSKILQITIKGISFLFKRFFCLKRIEIGWRKIPEEYSNLEYENKLTPP